MDIRPAATVPPVAVRTPTWRQLWDSTPVRLLQCGVLFVLILVFIAIQTFHTAQFLGVTAHIDLKHDKLWQLLFGELVCVPSALLPFWFLTRRHRRR